MGLITMSDRESAAGRDLSKVVAGCMTMVTTAVSSYPELSGARLWLKPASTAIERVPERDARPPFGGLADARPTALDWFRAADTRLILPDRSHHQRCNDDQE